MSKHYYLAIKFPDNEIKRDVWHCSQRTTKELAKMYDFLYPLDSKPRKNIDIREGGITMKCRTTHYLPLDSLTPFLREHSNVIAIQLVKTGIPQVYAVTTESMYTPAEAHMEVLRTFLDNFDEVLKDEEKAAMEYSIDCIKTLKDMGVIK